MPTDDRSSPSGDGFKRQALHQQQVSPSQIGESKGTGSRALVDTDFYAYKAAAASTFTAKWDEHNRIGMTNLSMAKDKFRGFVEWVEESVPVTLPSSAWEAAATSAMASTPPTNPTGGNVSGPGVTRSSWIGYGIPS